MPVASVAAEAKVFRVGVLDLLSPANSDFIKYLVPGLAKLGYVVGQNAGYAFRHLDWDSSKAPRFAEELVGLRPDVLVAESDPVIKSLADRTTTIPIVGACADPVGSGFTQSLSRPGRNITGFSLNAPGVAAKRIEFLKAIVPRLEHVAILGKEGPGNDQVSQIIERAAIDQGVVTSRMFFRDRSDVANGLQALKRKGVRAALDLLVSPSLLDDEEYARLAISAGIAVAYGSSDNELLLIGYHQSWEVALHWLRSRWPYMIDRVLRGTPPGDLPFELPDRYHLKINLATARALRLTIPEALLLQADKIIR